MSVEELILCNMYRSSFCIGECPFKYQKPMGSTFPSREDFIGCNTDGLIPKLRVNLIKMELKELKPGEEYLCD